MGSAAAHIWEAFAPIAAAPTPRQQLRKGGQRTSPNQTIVAWHHTCCELDPMDRLPDGPPRNLAAPPYSLKVNTVKERPCAQSR